MGHNHESVAVVSGRLLDIFDGLSKTIGRYDEFPSFARYCTSCRKARRMRDSSLDQSYESADRPETYGRL